MGLHSIQYKPVSHCLLCTTPITMTAQGVTIRPSKFPPPSPPKKKSNNTVLLQIFTLVFVLLLKISYLISMIHHKPRFQSRIKPGLLPVFGMCSQIWSFIYPCKESAVIFSYLAI